MENKKINFKRFERLLKRYAPTKDTYFEFTGVIGNTKVAGEQIKKIALALDLTTDSVKEAIQQKKRLTYCISCPRLSQKFSLAQKNKIAHSP